MVSNAMAKMRGWGPNGATARPNFQQNTPPGMAQESFNARGRPGPPGILDAAPPMAGLEPGPGPGGSGFPVQDLRGAPPLLGSMYNPNQSPPGFTSPMVGAMQSSPTAPSNSFVASQVGVYDQSFDVFDTGIDYEQTFDAFGGSHLSAQLTSNLQQHGFSDHERGDDVRDMWEASLGGGPAASLSSLREVLEQHDESIRLSNQLTRAGGIPPLAGLGDNAYLGSAQSLSPPFNTNTGAFQGGLQGDFQGGFQGDLQSGLQSGHQGGIQSGLQSGLQGPGVQAAFPQGLHNIPAAWGDHRAMEQLDAMPTLPPQPFQTMQSMEPLPAMNTTNLDDGMSGMSPDPLGAEHRGLDLRFEDSDAVDDSSTHSGLSRAERKALRSKRVAGFYVSCPGGLSSSTRDASIHQGKFDMCSVLQAKMRQDAPSLVCDISSGQVMVTNTECDQLFDCANDKSQLVKSDIFTLIHKDDRDKFSASLAYLMVSERVKMEPQEIRVVTFLGQTRRVHAGGVQLIGMWWQLDFTWLQGSGESASFSAAGSRRAQEALGRNPP